MLFYKSLRSNSLLLTFECYFTYRFYSSRFAMKQIYHKQVIGSSVQYMKSQLGINLGDWNQTKNK